MKIWKNFLPQGESLNDLLNIRPGPYFVDDKRNPVWETIFFQKTDNRWISLTWNYFDVEFRFEVYGISINHLEVPPSGLIQAGITPLFSEIKLVLETDWKRPAKRGEVPDNFVQVIEERGALLKVPDMAASAGTALYGVIFSNGGNESKLMISIDDSERYSLKSTVNPDEVDSLESSYDIVTLAEALAWTPPH
jgi:hypothetical protein